MFMQKLISILIFLIATPIFIQANEYDIVVAKDGSGNFKSVQEAILAVRAYTPAPKTIYIKDGRYIEKVVIPAFICDITIIGESKENTVITFDDHAKINNMGTFRSYSLKVEGHRITMKNLTVENNAPMVAQAVALHVEGTQFRLINCNLLGNQDTLFTGNDNGEQYYKNCYIEGTTDFIFGPATVWFEGCELKSKKNSYITAASTPDKNKYGYIFNNCNLTSDSETTKVFLGRPWRNFAYVLFMNCKMGKHIRPEGWHNWRQPEREKTSRYMEYNNKGAGAERSQRVTWSKELKRCEAKKITLKKVFPDWEEIDS